MCGCQWQDRSFKWRPQIDFATIPPYLLPPRLSLPSCLHLILISATHHCLACCCNSDDAMPSAISVRLRIPAPTGQDPKQDMVRGG